MNVEFIYVYVYKYVCIYACLCVYIFIYTHLYTRIYFIYLKKFLLTANDFLSAIIIEQFLIQPQLETLHTHTHTEKGGIFERSSKWDVSMKSLSQSPGKPRFFKNILWILVQCFHGSPECAKNQFSHSQSLLGSFPSVHLPCPILMYCSFCILLYSILLCFAIISKKSYLNIFNERQKRI